MCELFFDSEIRVSGEMVEVSYVELCDRVIEASRWDARKEVGLRVHECRC